MERSDNMGEKKRILNELNTAMEVLFDTSCMVSNTEWEQLSEQDYYKVDDMFDEAIRLVEEITYIIKENMKGE